MNLIRAGIIISIAMYYAVCCNVKLINVRIINVEFSSTYTYTHCQNMKFKVYVCTSTICSYITELVFEVFYRYISDHEENSMSFHDKFDQDQKKAVT